MGKQIFSFAVLSFAAAAMCFAEPQPYPTGRITLKTAVVVYNPIVTNTIVQELTHWKRP